MEEDLQVYGRSQMQSCLSDLNHAVKYQNQNFWRKRPLTVMECQKRPPLDKFVKKHHMPPLL
jgi:hypothetical protein